jgi:subtilisin family serine protease
VHIRAKIGVVVLGLVFSTIQAADAAPREDRSSNETITLITGDQVVMHNDTALSVRPGAGREKMTFSRFTAGGHTYVIPNDARRLVTTGQLDQRLFDLTTLVEFGYDDAHRDSVPLIVTQPANQRAPRTAAASRELPSINGFAMAADKTGSAWEALTDGSAVRTAAAGVSKVWLDGQRESTLDRSAAQIGAPAAWEAGVTGTGVKVAVLDTGVDQTHPDLADREIAEQNFSDAPTNEDLGGHGTHVASTVAGTGAKSNGKYRGIAHGASILDGKVLNDFGFGFDSWIIAGMEWAAEQGADIANLSLGGTDTTAVDPLEQAVESLSAKFGILFVIAAGNSGANYSIGSPGSAPSALTVGAVDRDDTLAFFSSRGPTQVDGLIKPDVTAPGVEIVAALHSAGTINAPVEDGYTALSGTSMATPHVAGAAALLAQQHPDWTGQQLKSALSGSAKPTQGLTPFDQGAGRIDVANALDQTIVTEQANVNLGTVAWPHDDGDGPLNRTLTYRNLGAAAVTVDLAVDQAGPDGAPSDVISLSANQITVPAGGTAEVTVTGDTSRGTADGAYSGAIVATAGDSVTRTPVAVWREVESYDVTFDYVDEQGAPTGDYSTFLIALDGDRFVVPYDEDGSLTVRLPKGRYVADHVVFTEQGAHANAVVQPGLMVDGDQTVDIDPTVTRPVSVTPPAAATLELGDIGYQVEGDGFPVFGGPLTTDLSSVSTAQLGDALPGTTMLGWVNTTWLGEDEAFYNLAWFLDEFPTGYTRTVSRRELATVRTEFGPGAEGDRALPFTFPQPVSGDAGVWAVGFDFPLPGTRTTYVTTENIRWLTTTYQLKEDLGFVGAFDSPSRSYRQGRTYHERFNHPVFSPGLPESQIGIPWAFRSADTIDVAVPLYTDGAGNAGFTEDSGTTKLYLGNRLVGESPFAGGGSFADLPAARGDYRLTTESVRPARFTLTTAVSAEWTFQSSHVDGSEQKPLDLNVVRFAPKLDANGSAPAGTPFLVPLRVQDQTSTDVRVRRLSAEVSYDEGRTWQRVPVINNMVAKLNHPAGATSVSLRASATDRDGSTVEQTVIRAYTLR